jgi:methionyl-tRNA formyltransferase
LTSEPIGPGADPWRVVVVTNIPGGLVYRIAADVLRPLGHRIVGVVTSPGPKRRRSPAYLDVVAAVPPGIDVIISNRPERWAAMLVPLRPDLIICGGMPWHLPPELLALPRLGAINIHPSLLPRHRGPASIEWAFRSGDTEIGFTVHRMAPGFDTGPILAQERLPIADDDDFESLMGKLGPQIPGLLQRALERVANGDPGEPQDESQATYAGMFENEWRIIDWTQPARTIHNQVRSWIGFREVSKGAFGELDGETIQITKTRLLPTDSDHAPSSSPGAVLRRTADELVVQCGDGPIAVLAWHRPEGVSDDIPTRPA